MNGRALRKLLADRGCQEVAVLPFPDEDGPSIGQFVNPENGLTMPSSAVPQDDTLVEVRMVQHILDRLGIPVEHAEFGGAEADHVAADRPRSAARQLSLRRPSRGSRRG
jgi:hypothetical protein